MTIKKCIQCGVITSIYAKGLCSSCYHKKWKKKQTKDNPRKNLPFIKILKRTEIEQKSVVKQRPSSPVVVDRDLINMLRRTGHSTEANEMLETYYEELKNIKQDELYTIKQKDEVIKKFNLRNRYNKNRRNKK